MRHGRAWLGMAGLGEARQGEACVFEASQLRRKERTLITAKAYLKSDSPYSQSRYVEKKKKQKELDADFEARTWRQRCHVMRNGPDEGKIYIPPMSFKHALAGAAKYLGIKIPGKRNATWTKHFKSGVLVQDPLVLPIRADEVDGEWLFVPSDGRPGGGSRVSKCFPFITEWQGEVTFYVLDETITEDAFAYHLEQAGRFMGIGRFRPQNGGYYGRFSVNNIDWITE